jgi:hypothetical protein
MKTINKQSENMGGVIKLWAIPPADYSITGKIVTITSDTNLIGIYIQEDSGSFTEDPIEGSAFKTEIAGVVPCDNETSLAVIRDLERIRKFNVIYLDGNGKFKLAGNKNVPLRFSAKHATGASTASLNHYAISFLAKVIKDRAIFIEDSFLQT